MGEMEEEVAALAMLFERSGELDEPLYVAVEGPGPCPECRDDTMLIQGKNGFFFGCINFPKCPGTRRYSHDSDNPNLVFSQARKKVPMEEVKITYRGWGAHYIGALDCIFRLNTLVELGEKRYIVSTVGGQMVSRPRRPAYREISPGVYFETKIFPAMKLDLYWDADVTKEISYPGGCMVEYIIAGDIKAQKNHEAAVSWVADQLRKGEL